MNLKRSLSHSLLISIPVLLIGFNMAFQVPARSLHLLHAHHHPGSLSGHRVFHGCFARPHFHLSVDDSCSVCNAFDLFHTVFFSKPFYFPGYFTGTAGPVPFHSPPFIQAFYLFCYARAPPGLIFPDQTV